MKVSIVTVCFNSEKTVEATIKSVLSQQYKNIEYIVVDGGSSDGTKRIIKKNIDKISVVISEKDRGIYDAMNKGLENSTGDVIGFLNSDDVFASDAIVSEIVEKFSLDKDISAVIGDVAYYKHGYPGKKRDITRRGTSI